MGSSAPRKLHTDVLVIGSGAGGAVTAAALAEAGRDVLVVEEGPKVERMHIPVHLPDAVAALARHGGLTPLYGNPIVTFTEGRCAGGGTELSHGHWQPLSPDMAGAWHQRYLIRELSGEQAVALTAELEAGLGLRGRPAGAGSSFERLAAVGELPPRPAPGRGPLNPSLDDTALNRSMARTYLPRAVSAGAKLLTHTRVQRMHQQRGRVYGVTAVRELPGWHEPLRIIADEVVLCAGALRTPALLRAAGIRANVGDQLVVQPTLTVAAVFERGNIPAVPLGHTSGGAPLSEDITISEAVSTPGRLARVLSENWQANQCEMADWRAAALFDVRVRGDGQGSVRATPLTNEPVVRYALTHRDRRRLSDGLLHLVETLLAAGARKVHPGLRGLPVLTSAAEARELLEQPLHFNDFSLSAMQAVAGCAAGEHETAAVDSFGRVHGFTNLRVSDASILPDLPGPHPQGAIMTLALRNARRLVEAA